MTTVGDIAIEVGADIGPMVRELRKAEGALRGFEGAADRMGKGLAHAGGVAVTVGKRIALVAAGIAAVTGATTVFVKNASGMGAAIDDASKAAGMSTTAFQEYRFALKDAAAMSDGDFAAATARLNKTLGEARQGSDAAIRAFEAIGVSQAQLKSSSFSTDDALAAFVQKVESIKDPAVAAAVATGLFGRAGASLGAAISGTPGQIKSLVDRARELGVVLGPDAVEAAGKFDQKMEELGNRFEIFKVKLADKLLPVFVDDIIPAIEKHVIPAFEWLAGRIAWAAEGIVEFARIASESFTNFKTAVGGAVDWVSGKFEAFLAMLDRIVEKAVAVKEAIADALKYDASSSANTFNEDFGMGGDPANNSNAFGGAGGAAGGQMLGAAIVNGAVLGAVNSLNENREALASVFEGITQIARETLGIHSPSKVFEEIGGNLGQGMAQGIAAANGVVAAAVKGMTDAATVAADEGVAGVLGAMGQLFQGSKKISAGIALANSWLAFTEVLSDKSFAGRPWARFAAASSALASGLNAVRNIKSTQPGGGGAGGGAGGASAGAAAAPAQQNVQTLNFTLQNDSLGIGQNLVRQIAAQLNEAQRNGATLIRATVS